ncbi:MAG: helix-turn-helix domain-containing protein [Kiritimatiellae bacterium]|nr:helix-turn-helix domain-containing protein [Kiritimatiellia bacterium]
MARTRRRLLQAADFFKQTGMPLYVRRIDVSRGVARHAHGFTELVVTLGGQGEHRTEDEHYSISAGDTFVIRPGEVHEYGKVRRLEVVNVIFDAGRMGVPSADIGQLPGYHVLFSLEPEWRRRHRAQSRLKLPAEALRHAEAMLRGLETELTARRGGYRFMARGLFMQLLVFLSRSYLRMRQPESVALLRIGRVLGFMEQHYAEPMTVPQLVAMAHMSESSLLRAFRNALASTPIAYLIRLRIRKAAGLLADENARVTEAAYRVGFSDSNYFSRQFRRVMGMSPRAYKRRARGDTTHRQAR